MKPTIIRDNYTLLTTPERCSCCEKRASAYYQRRIDYRLENGAYSGYVAYSCKNDACLEYLEDFKNMVLLELSVENQNNKTNRTKTKSISK